MPVESVEKEVTIASGQTESGAVDTTDSHYLAGLIIPALTTSTAITFKVSTDGTNFYELQDDTASLVSYSVDNTKEAALTVPAATFYAWEYIKIVVADSQAADRLIKAIVREY